MASRNIVKLWKNSRSILFLQKSLPNCINLRNVHVIISPSIQNKNQFFQISSKFLQFSTKNEQKQLLIDLDNQNLEKLRTELSTSGFVNIETLSKAVEALNCNLTEMEGNFLIDCCNSLTPTINIETKFQIFKNIWDSINKSGNLTKTHYVKAVKIFENNPKFSKYFQELLNECPFKDDIEIHQCLMQLIAEEGNIERAEKFLNEIRLKSFKLNENLFNSLIIAYSKNGKLDGCKNVLETMNAANLLPNSETYTQLICANIQNGLEDETEKLLTDHGSFLQLNQIIHIIRNAALKNMRSVIEKCLKFNVLDCTNVKEVPLLLRKLCIQLIYEGHPNEAFLIVNSFQKPIFNENQNIDTFGVFLLFEFIKSNQPTKKVIEICEELMRNEKNTRALHIACEIALRRQSENSMEYLKALSKFEQLRPHYFWPIFIQNFQFDGESGILNTIKTMNELNVEFDYDTISTHILPKLSVTLEDEQKAIKIFESYGLKTSVFMTPLISHLLFQQKYDEILSILDLYQTKLNTEDLIYPLINAAMKIQTATKLCKLLHAIKLKSDNANYDFIGKFLIELFEKNKFHNKNNANDKEFCLNLLNNLNNIKNLKISSTAANIILMNLQHNFKNNELKLLLNKIIDNELNLPLTYEFHGSNILHPRDMNLDELECHLVELESKNLNTRGVLRRLLQMCVREGKLQRALEIKEKCDKLKVQISPGMMASIFDLYIKLKNLDEAEKCFYDCKRLFPGFSLDEHKIIDFASLLIENNRLEDAKRILKGRKNIIGGDYVLKNIWQLLTNVAKLSTSLSTKSTKNQTKEMFDILHALGYCKPDNKVLGPIIREWITRKEIKLAVDEYTNCVKMYKKTPLQFELMSLLVNLSNNNLNDEYQLSSDEAKKLLQDIIALTSTVHGNINTNSALLLAICESGTSGQLRKLLIDPNFRFNENILLKNCEHLSNSGKIHILLKLAKSTRGLNHIIKEQNLYNLLLDQFIKDNNYESAIKLYEQLNNDDEFKISTEFVRNLVNLLKMNNLEIPSNLAIRAQIM